jgi:thymidylate synthase
MKQYLSLLEELLNHGVQSTDRTGVGTLRKAGHMMRFDLAEGFPLVTTKKLHLRSIIHELLWFLRGDTNVRYLQENGVGIWDEWVDEEGNLGPVYGMQWRKWEYPSGFGNMLHIDQIQNAVDKLRTSPDDRGIIVTAWNPADLPKMALRPCHCLFQLLVIDGRLSLQLTQRSCDSFLGVPYNIASYAFLTHMFAQQADLEVGELIWVGGDVHLYKNHVSQAEMQIARTPKKLPRLKLRKAESMFDYKFEDFEIVDYVAWPAISAPVAV